MSTTISKVAYKAVWDSSNLAKGLMSTRAMFLEQKKILQSLQQPVDRYTQSQQNLASMLAKFPDIQKHKIHLEQQIEKQYLQEEAALRKLTGSEKVRLWQLMSQDEKAAARKAGLQKLEEAQRRMTEAKEREHQKRLQMIRRNSEDMERARRDNAIQREREHQKRLQMIRYNSADLERARLKAQQEQEKDRAGGLTILGRDPRLAAAALAAGAGFGAKRMLSDGVDAFRDLERVEAAFNVFSKSLAESRNLIQQIRDLSSQTGVSFAGLADGAKTLMLRDIDASKTISMMQKIAIVTGGNTDNMKSMALAMGQINQAGKLMGQELIQLVNAGWTPLEEIVKKTGIPMGEMRKEMESGRISFQMVSDALDAAVSKGGRYFGFLESLEGTTARAADKTASAWEQASARIGSAFKPVTLAFSEASAGFAGGAADFFGGIGSWLSTYFDRETAIQNQMAAWESNGGNAMVGMIGRDSKSLDAKLAPGMKMIRDFDARMKAEQDAKQKAVESSQKAALAREAALKPSEAGTSLIRQAGTQLEREKLLSLKLAEGESQRVKAMEKRLELAERIAIREKRSAELQKDGITELEIRRIIALEERLTSLQTAREKSKLENDRRAKQLKESRTVADRYSSPDAGIIGELAEMELARRRGVLSQSDFDRASLGLVQERSASGGSLAANMHVGSQEAYSFMAGVQDRSKREEMARHRETVRLQGLMLKAIEKLDNTMKDLETVGIAG